MFYSCRKGDGSEIYLSPTGCSQVRVRGVCSVDGEMMTAGSKPEGQQSSERKTERRLKH